MRWLMERYWKVTRERERGVPSTPHDTASHVLGAPLTPRQAQGGGTGRGSQAELSPPQGQGAPSRPSCKARLADGAPRRPGPRGREVHEGTLASCVLCARPALCLHLNRVTHTPPGRPQPTSECRAWLASCATPLSEPVYHLQEGMVLPSSGMFNALGPGSRQPWEVNRRSGWRGLGRASGAHLL